MIKEHIILAVLWIVYCVLHSLLAAPTVKQWFHRVMGRHFAHYRLLYTLFAFLTLTALLWFQVSLSSPSVFRGSALIKVIGWIMLLTGAGTMLYCIRKYFMSLSGLRSLIRPEDASNQLIITGIHRYVRHPLYLGTFLFIWGLWFLYPVLSLLIAGIIITLYTLIGITFEERKLEAEFGENYRIYKEQVPKILPFK